jgi:signal transduction histidine kinase
VTAVILAAVVAGLVHLFGTQSDAAVTRSLTAEARSFQAALLVRPSNQDLPAFTESYLRTRVLADGQHVVVALADRGWLGSAGSEPVVTTAAVRDWLRRPPAATTVTHADVGGRATELIATPIEQTGRRVGTMIATADLTRTRADQSRVRYLVASEAGVALLASVIGAFLLLRRLLRTIGDVTTTAARLGSGELSRRIGPQPAGDEVGRLAATFDAMADRVQNAITAQRRLLSDASHQLRTPLTVARGHLEVLSRTAANDPVEVRETVALVVDELDHMRALVERFLLLGHAMEPDFVQPEAIDLRSFLADLVESCTVLASRDWQLGPVPDLVLSADPSKLRGALLNLVDNAVKATRDGDVIAVSVETTGAWVRLSVGDSGHGIDAADRLTVLERFRRSGPGDARGDGLGLAIVKAVAEAHAGRVEVAESVWGGCKVTMTLPLTTVTAVEIDA